MLALGLAAQTSLPRRMSNASKKRIDTKTIGCTSCKGVSGSSLFAIAENHNCSHMNGFLSFDVTKHVCASKASAVSSPGATYSSGAPSVNRRFYGVPRHGTNTEMWCAYCSEDVNGAAQQKRQRATTDAAAVRCRAYRNSERWGATTRRPTRKIKNTSRWTRINEMASCFGPSDAGLRLSPLPNR